jgi:hypothetical protein
MNKARVNRLERNLSKKRGSIELPIFLDMEGDSILFTDSLLFGLGINPEEYPIYPGKLMDTQAQGREIPISAPFISHITGDSLHLKGYEDRQIILLKWEDGNTGD